MTRPWETLERVETGDGPLELRRRRGPDERGPGDFLIVLAGRILMNSAADRSEAALAEHGCAALAAQGDARVLIGGLGMGITLRAALDRLPQTATVQVAELHPVIARWCRGPLAPVSGRGLADPRVALFLGDVATCIGRAAAGPPNERFDAILLDLYGGPGGVDDPVFGSAALGLGRGALRRSGVLACWSEAPEPRFEKRLQRAGFDVTRHRAGRGGRRHAITVATATP
ncbi:MAG: spermidine synthase [Proteobacteria bacterium]|nr:spermidine synthase [Pseudomonadota bacterium]